ncbi:MAG: 50S ribosomal protein L28 [Planctomycetes bacterium]|nr:50S ribosomal protein L28 [Planctomycetota bacterium]
MSRECDFCGKRTASGYQVSRRGLAKRRGGVGIKCTAKSRRTFKPNTQRVRAVVDGVVRRVLICAQCLRSGRLTKPVRRRADRAAAAAPAAAPIAAPAAAPAPASGDSAG